MAKGGCWKIGTIPILEWGEAGQECQRIRNERHQDNLDFREQRNRDNEEGRNTRSYNRNFGTEETPIEGIVDSAAGAAVGLVPFITSLATGGLSAIPTLIGDVLGGLGGLAGGGSAAPSTSSSTDYVPYVLGAGALLVVVLVVTSDDGKKR